MADLTGAQEKDYTRQIAGILKQYQTEMKAKDVDPASRITNLDIPSGPKPAPLAKRNAPFHKSSL